MYNLLIYNISFFLYPQTSERQTNKPPTAEATHIRCDKCWNNKPTNVQQLKQHISDATNVAMTNVAITNQQMSNSWGTNIRCDKCCNDKHCNNKPTNIQRLKRNISDAKNIAMTKFAITNQQMSNGWSNKYQMWQTSEWQTDKHSKAEVTHIGCDKCCNDKPTNIQRLKWHISDATNVAMTNVATTNQQTSKG